MKDNYKYVIDNKSSNDVAKQQKGSYKLFE